MHDKTHVASGDELYRRYLGGDEDALRELIYMYQEPLMAFLLQFTGNVTEARELAIDAFTELAIHKNRFRGESALKTYLFSIGRNLALKHRREQKRYLQYDISESMDASADQSSAESLIRVERELRLEAAMKQLKPEHYTVLRLLYYENMSYAKAGGVMNKTEVQIANLAYRARISLRKKLEREGFVYEE